MFFFLNNYDYDNPRYFITDENDNDNPRYRWKFWLNHCFNIVPLFWQSVMFIV